MANDIEKAGDGKPGVTLTAVANEERDHNPVFEALVSEEGEIAGLVAYSLYKQNKRSWIEDFKKLTGRLPTDSETRAYIIGESTERRLATYRVLAENALGGQAIHSASASRMSSVATALWVLITLLALIAIGSLLHAFGLIASK